MYLRQRRQEMNTEFGWWNLLKHRLVGGKPKIWRWQLSGILCPVVSKKTYVSDDLTVSIIRAMNSPDDALTHLRNDGQLRRDYGALYARKLSFSYSPPWETEISNIKICLKEISVTIGGGWNLPTSVFGLGVVKHSGSLTTAVVKF
jgi:hypothetical protein